MAKTLVLATNIDQYLVNGSYCITELYAHNTKNRILRSIRKVSLKTGIGVKLFLGNWYSKCKCYDSIILFDTGNANYLIKLLHRKVPECRLILWYWNPVERTISINSIDSRYCEVWSYHTDDCRKYGLHFNTQFFISDDNIKRINAGREINKNILSNQNPQKSIKQDVYFVGADKNRTPILYEIERVLKKNKITYKFILTMTNGSRETSIPYSKSISAEESRENVNSSKAIIDIVDVSQASGLTLRPLEAAMSKKKLITNNKNIAKMKFYNPNNIFIWGMDKEENLKVFINSPYDTSTDTQIDFYSYDSWLMRFWE